MLCLVCGAEMRLVQVVKDTVMLVSGYEHHTWKCSGCSTIETRMTFAHEKTNQPLEPTQVVPVETAPAEPTHLRPPITTVQTNVWFEKLRRLKERAAAARETAQSR
jgi:hypothetical protein